MDEKQFKEISGKLDLITRLLALNLVKDMKTQNEKILTLSNFGFSPTDIANSLGTSSNTVNVALSRIRSKGKKQTSETSTKESDKQEIQTTEGLQKDSGGELNA